MKILKNFFSILSIMILLTLGYTTVFKTIHIAYEENIKTKSLHAIGLYMGEEQKVVITNPAVFKKIVHNFSVQIKKKLCEIITVQGYNGWAVKFDKRQYQDNSSYEFTSIKYNPTPDSGSVKDALMVRMFRENEDLSVRGPHIFFNLIDKKTIGVSYQNIGQMKAFIFRRYIQLMVKGFKNDKINLDADKESIFGLILDSWEPNKLSPAFQKHIDALVSKLEISFLGIKKTTGVLTFTANFSPEQKAIIMVDILNDQIHLVLYKTSEKNDRNILLNLMSCKLNGFDWKAFKQHIKLT